MERRRIGGEDGFDVPVVGLGCNAFGRRIDEQATRAVIHAALDAGVTFFDTAEAYGGGLSEEFIGRAIAGRRNEVILATKFGLNTSHIRGKGPGSRDNAFAAVDRSLRKLRTDRIDLYQLHRPDPATPVGETLGALNDLAKAGKIRLFGCSNFSAAQWREALDVARREELRCFVTAQDEWNVLERGIEGDIVPLCAKNGIGILPYYPLAQGLLTGKYRRGETPPAGSRLAGRGTPAHADFAMLEKLEAFATRRDFDLLTLAVSWLASQPVTASVIAGATRPEQLPANAAAARWEMTAEDFAAIDAIVGR